MTGLLASVSNLHEARMALVAGVDVVDLKDPQQGVLGAVSPSIARAVVKWVDGRCLVSATVGDLPMHATRIEKAVVSMAKSGVDIIKIGVFGTFNDEILSVLAVQAKAGHTLIVVFFADHAPDLGVLPSLAGAGVRGVMLDTADKRHGHLRVYCDDCALVTFIDKARALGLMVGLAGSLRACDIADLTALNPDYLGFRGALCHKSRRTQAIDPEAVCAIRSLVTDGQRNSGTVRV